MGLGDFLNVFPVVGHVKGIIHYACGDTEEGNKAMYQATRTTFVVGGGAIGFVGGPAGSALIGTAGGMLTDLVATVATEKPQGILGNIDNIAKDIDRGENPFGSVAKTVVDVGLDAVGGLGGGGIVNAAIKESGKTAGKEIGKKALEKMLVEKATLTANVVYCAQKAKEAEGSSYTYIHTHLPTNKSPNTNTNTNDNSKNKSTQNNKDQNPNQDQDRNDPPKRKPNNPIDKLNEEDAKVLQQLLDYFKVDSLDQILINGVNPFANLSLEQIKYLIKILKNMIKTKHFKELLTIIVQVLKSLGNHNINFPNFLSIAELAMVVTTEWFQQRSQILAASTSLTYQQRIHIINNEFNISTMVSEILRIMREIGECFKSMKLIISFRDSFAAIYHYWKHRITANGTVLSVPDYCQLINKHLQTIRNHRFYQELVSGRRNMIHYEYFDQRFGRRFRIILKKIGNIIGLCTAFFIDREYPNDKDGDTFYF